MTSLISSTAAQAAGSGGGPGGLTGFVLDVVAAMGPLGVGVLGFLEVVFPPIPSEIVLPLAGYQVQQGRMELLPALLLSLLGTVGGAFVLYRLGARLGEERMARLIDRVPLMEAEDMWRASRWFRRHEGSAVFTGRFVPGVRSLVSLPAGAAHMSLVKFGLLTLAGSALWNGALIALGMALGTQYRLVEEYASYIDYALYAALAVFVVRGIRRSVRRRRQARHTGRHSEESSSSHR